MPDYAVSTAFNGKDNVSALFDKMGRAAGRFGNEGKQAFRGVGREADHASTAFRNATKHGYAFGSIVKGILAANAIRGGIGYVTGGLQKIGSDYLQFGDTMTGAVARFDEVDTRSAAFGTTIESMGKQVRKSMAGTRHSALDGAEGLNELAKAGYNSQAALGILPNLAAFATAAQEKLGEATTMSSDILGAFGGKNDDVSVQLKNHIKLNDQLTKTALISTGGMRDLYETLKVAAPISKEMGVAQETVLALSVALSNAGIKGDMAATALKRGMFSLYASSNKAELELNGVFAYDKLGNPRKFTAVLGDMGRALDKLTPEQRIPLLKQYFGIYGLAGTLKMMRELKAVAGYEEKIKGADGLSQRMADAANTSPLAKLIMLGNTAMEKGFQVLDQYASKGKSGVEWLTEKVKNFDVRPLIYGISAAGSAFLTFYRIVEPFLPALPYVVAGFVAWKGAILGWNVAMGVFSAFKTAKLIFDIGAALTAGLGPMGAMTTAFGALGNAIAVAMAPLVAAAPVLTTVLAILGAAGYTAHMAGQNWGDNRSADDLVAEAAAERKRKAGWVVDAPNAGDAQARASVSSWMGQLNIAGAPPGSTMTQQSTGAASISTHLLGVNP